MNPNNPVDAKYLRESAKITDALKRKTYERMEIRSGACVLDAGCGVGVDTVRLVDLVGEGGRVIGVDADAGMLAEADRSVDSHPLKANISHEFGDVLALAYGDEYFDAVRAERLLQVLPKDYEKAVVAELARVLKSGGRLVIADTDWASASVAMGDDALERKLLRFFAESMRPNGYSGRNLFSLLVEAGLEDISVDIFPMVSYSAAQTPFGTWLSKEALAQNIADEGEITRWQEALQSLESQGRFYACVNMVIVSGRKS